MTSNTNKINSSKKKPRKSSWALATPRFDQPRVTTPQTLSSTTATHSSSSSSSSSFSHYTKLHNNNNNNNSTVSNSKNRPTRYSTPRIPTSSKRRPNSTQTTEKRRNTTQTWRQRIDYSKTQKSKRALFTNEPTNETRQDDGVDNDDYENGSTNSSIQSTFTNNETNLVVGEENNDREEQSSLTSLPSNNTSNNASNNTDYLETISLDNSNELLTTPEAAKLALDLCTDKSFSSSSLLLVDQQQQKKQQQPSSSPEGDVIDAEQSMHFKVLFPSPSSSYSSDTDDDLLSSGGDAFVEQTPSGSSFEKYETYEWTPEVTTELDTNNNYHHQQLMQTEIYNELLSNIPRIEGSLGELENTISHLNQKVKLKDEKIANLLSKNNKLEDAIVKERNLRVKAEFREKTASTTAYTEAATDARRYAVEQVRHALSSEEATKLHYINRGNYQNTEYKETVAILERKLKEKDDEIKRLYEINEKETSHLKEVHDKYVKNNLTAKMDQKRHSVKLHQELVSLRCELIEAKKSSLEIFELASSSIQQNCANIKNYVNEEMREMDLSTKEIIHDLQQELHEAREEITRLKIDDNRMSGTDIVVEATPLKDDKNQNSPLPKKCEPSPIPTLQSWNDFSHKFRKAIDGKLPLSNAKVDHQLDSYGVIQAEKLFKELCFEVSSPIPCSNRRVKQEDQSTLELIESQSDDDTFQDAQC